MDPIWYILRCTKDSIYSWFSQGPKYIPSMLPIVWAGNQEITTWSGTIHFSQWPRGPWWFAVFHGGYNVILPSYIGIIISQGSRIPINQPVWLMLHVIHGSTCCFRCSRHECTYGCSCFLFMGWDVYPESWVINELFRFKRKGWDR